jgi:predicted MPP superfamily phosphohydrolase
MEQETKEQVKRRRFLWGTILILIILFSYYIWFIEPNNIILKKEKIRIGLNKSVKMILISDIHIETISDNYLEKAIVMINSEKPDYIFIAGDFSDASATSIKRLNALTNLKPKNSSYAVFGNHDYPFHESTCATNVNNSLISKEAELESLNINILRNEVVDAGDFFLIGIDELWACKNNYTEATAQLNNSKPRIVLVHNSNAIPREEFKANNLILSGHTHCGQWRAPFIGSPLSHLGLISEYDMGLHKIDNESYIYTTCGLGGGARFLAPPEITVIELQ